MLSTQTNIESCREQVVQLFCEVFHSMLQLDIYPYLEPSNPTPHPIVISSVCFSGSWQGTALLECSLDLAILFTERLMAGCKPTSFDDDVRDSMGELANMLGGNIKAFLPDRVELSIPSVIEGHNNAVRLIGKDCFVRMAFFCDAGTFVVVIAEAGPH